MQRSTRASVKAGKKRTPSPTKEETPRRFLQDSLKALLLTVGLGALLLLLVALALSFIEDPLARIPAAGLLLAAVTAFFGGGIAVRIHRTGALLCGLGNGAGLLLLMLPLSLLFRSEASGYSSLVSCLLHAALLLLSVGGAFFLRPRPKRHQTRKRT